MVDPKRHINILTEDQQEFIDECEEEFKYRFTENDPEFMEYCNKLPKAPPILEFQSRRFNNGNNQGYNSRGGGGGRGGGRFNNYRRDNREHPYRNYEGGHSRNNNYNNRYNNRNVDRRNDDNQNQQNRGDNSFERRSVL